MRKHKKTEGFVVFLLGVFTLTREPAESNPAMTGWLLNAVCLCHGCVYEGGSVFYLKQYVTLGFTLWLSKLESMFSWDNNRHDNPQFSKAKDNFKREAEMKEVWASLICLFLQGFVYLPRFRGKWECSSRIEYTVIIQKENMEIN